MKRLISTLVLSTVCIGPFAQAQPARIEFGRPGSVWVDQRNNPDTADRQDRNERADARQDERRDDRLDRREAEVRQDRAELNRDRRQWRDNRRNAQWDQSLHNGYYTRNKQWHYGQPSRAYMRQPGFSYGYRPWTRGERLGGYNQRFVELDYRGHNLRAPPRGYRWVEDDRGDYLLAAIVGGLIAQVIINSPR